jgi:hypothetical protein
MAAGREEGNDEWELDGVLRTVYVRPERGRRKRIWFYALYNEREMSCKVTAHALIAFRPYLRAGRCCLLNMKCWGFQLHLPSKV